MQIAMISRVNRRKQAIQAHCDRVIREIEAGKHGGEEGRIWLEQYCKGEGLQICPGEFSLGDSIGVDSDPRSLGMDLWAYADHFVPSGAPLDYIVTNYLECFADTLRVLMHWRELLKPEGILAVIARDAEMYLSGVGPLVNPRRLSVFTRTTLHCYLVRAGFDPIRWESFDKEIRVAARKR